MNMSQNRYVVNMNLAVGAGTSTTTVAAAVALAMESEAIKEVAINVELISIENDGEIIE